MAIALYFSILQQLKRDIPAAQSPAQKHAVDPATTVFCMAAGSWYLVTAGSKEVLMAWRFSFQACSSSAGVSLKHQWLATRPPPRTGLRPQSHKQGASVAATEHRYMALAVMPHQEGCLHIAAASSSATLQLLRLDLSSKR